jgi:glutamate-1-semialdehyde 2,1-aminomutase
MEILSSKEQYIAKFPKSKALYQKAQGAFSRGVSHDAWYILPFPIFIASAKRSHEWDVDGYEYVDYFGGHGGLILGHAHPAIIEAVHRQIERGTQYGACDELSLEWADLIRELVPSAERVEFTNSGTEANMLGVRLARAFSGREKIVKFRQHFGGWADAVDIGLRAPWHVAASSGLPTCVTENTLTIPCNNEEILAKTLSKKDVALLMVEAAGAASGRVGIAPSFYPLMRELTKKYGTLLLFDEVVTGFRYSPGGVQSARGITPDLTTLGKSLNGCIPGAGAVVGRADIMDMLLFGDDEWNRYGRVSHDGTFNANPLCAASGIAALKILSTGEPQNVANESAEILRTGMQEVMDRLGVTGCVYGDFSVFHIYIGQCDMQGECDRRICLNEDKIMSADIGRALAINLALNGVHMPGYGTKGFLSAAHTREDLDKTIEAFEISINSLIREGY